MSTQPKPAHTPTPWRLARRTSRSLIISGETVIAETQSKATAYDEELIVRAVNSHAELVAALERIRDYPAGSNSEPDVMANALDTIEGIARAALAKAQP